MHYLAQIAVSKRAALTIHGVDRIEEAMELARTLA
jgi:hypothetical protein